MQIDKNTFIRFIIFISGIFSTLFVAFSDSHLPQIYMLIPLFYSSLILLFPNTTKYALKSIGILALNLCMFIRYSVMPLLNVITNNSSQSNSIIFNESYESAVFLMLYEMIVVFVIFNLFYKRFYQDKINEKSVYPNYNFIGWIYIAFCGILLILYPGLIDSYSFILTADELESKGVGEEVPSSLGLFISIGRLILIISLVNLFYKKYEKSPNIIFVILSMASVILFSSFIAGTSRFSVILPLVTGLFIIYIVFNMYRKLVLVFSSVSIISITLLSSFLKTRTINPDNVGNNTGFENLANTLELYFSGISNVAIAIQTRIIYPAFEFSSIISDVFSSVMVVNSFFDSVRSALEEFNVIFYNGGPARDQILPMIGQGYLYFDFILAPLLLVISLILLMYFDSKAISSKRIFTKFIYTFIALKLGLIMMSNFTITLSFITNNFIPLMLIVLINNIFIERRRVDYEDREKRCSMGLY